MEIIKKSIFVSVVLVFLTSYSACTSDIVLDNGTGAGVLVSFVDKDNVRWVILSREAQSLAVRGTYSAFSGGRESSDAYPFGTAAREWWEESMGAFTSADTIEKAQNYLKNHFDVVVDTQKGKVIYLVSVPLEDALQFKQSFFEHKKRREAARAPSHLLEKDALAYVKWDDLAHALRDNKRKVTAVVIEEKCKRRCECKKSIKMRKQLYKRLKPYFSHHLQSDVRGK